MSGVPPGQYYVRLVVVQDPNTSSERTLYSDPQPFTIASREVGTGEATNLDDPSGTVQLNGYFTYPAGTNVTSYYEYGPCPLNSHTASTTAPVSTIATGSPQAMPPGSVTALSPGDYCYRTVVVTMDASGNPVYAYGNRISFHVNGGPGVQVITSTVTNVDKPPGSATVNGVLDFPTGTPVQYYMEYR